MLLRSFICCWAPHEGKTKARIAKVSRRFGFFIDI